MWKRQKPKEFQYDIISRLGLALAIELWNREAYRSSEPQLTQNSQGIEFDIRRLEENRSDSVMSWPVVLEPRYGLPESSFTKLRIKKDTSNQYGFTLHVGEFDKSTPEIAQRNLGLKERIEQAWESYNLPYEK